MSGTIPLSLSQQFDRLGNPLAGGKLYIIQAGTVSTPQVAYQDAALTLPYPGGSVLTLDSAGRIGQFFLADGMIKIRLTDKNGIEQIVADGVQVIGPSGGGGGGGGSVDPTTILATGDIKAKYGTGVLTGFVRANGRTIGSATSGSTERANADTQFLFEYLWNVDANLVVSTGRGASANADWVANKTIALPDWRGRGLFAMDDMGNTSANRLSPAGVPSSTLGGSGGAPNTTLSTGNLPPYTPAGIVPISDPGHAHLYKKGAGSTAGPGGPGALYQGDVDQFTDTRSTGITATFVGIPQGGTSAAFNILSPVMVTTFYIKL